MQNLTPISKVISNDLKTVTNSAPIMKNGCENTPLTTELFKCVLCEDYGHVYPRLENGKVDYSHTVPCLCRRDQLERKKKHKLLTWCELPPASEHMTFEQYRVLPNTIEAFKAAQDVAVGTLPRLTLVSKTGQGKTHLSVAICREWLKLDKPARYAYVPLLLDEIRRGYQDGKDYERRFELFLNVPLLVLDDLGTEYSTPWVQEKLDTIVDYRLMHDLATVITTNLSLSQISERVASRLQRGGGRVVTL